MSMNLILESTKSLTPSDLLLFKLGGYTPEWVDETHVSFNILSTYKSGGIRLMLSPRSEDCSFTFTMNAMIHADYITYTFDRPTKKSFPLVEGAECVVDLHSQDELFVFPVTSGHDSVAISQIYKKSLDDFRCGNNFRLSLH